MSVLCIFKNSYLKPLFYSSRLPCLYGKQRGVSERRNDVIFSRFIRVDFHSFFSQFHLMSKLTMNMPVYESQIFVEASRCTTELLYQLDESSKYQKKELLCCFEDATNPIDLRRDQITMFMFHYCGLYFTCMRFMVSHGISRSWFCRCF